MKNFALFVIISLFSFFKGNSYLEETTVQHDINEVTVYLNSAEIHRTAQVSIPAGKSDLLFKGISSRIMEQGMKVQISNGVKVYAVNIEDNENVLEENQEWIALEKDMDALDDEKGLLGIELKTLFKELDYLESNMKIGGNNGATFSQLEEGAKYFRKKIQALEVKIYAINEQQEELQEKRTEMFGKRDKLKKGIEKVNKIIRVTVISDIAQKSDVDLRYLVNNAVWKPYYSLRSSGKDDPIVLEYQAQIYNDTGNDWDNKKMTLAIMDPSEDVSKPLLDAWVLDEDSRYDDDEEGRLSDAKGRYKKSDKDDKKSYNVLRVDDLSTRFEIKDKHLIPSDATPHLIDVTTYTKAAEYYTLSIPKVKDGAFLIARIPGWESLGLLDGPMNLYYNDTYQGVSLLDTRQVSDTLDISLGKENSYTITRRKLSSMNSKRLLGTSIKETLTYEFIIKNNKNQTAEIEVRDQLPVSTDKDVEVKPLFLNGAKVDVLSGQLTWYVKLKPNESKKIELRFSVKYPKNKRGIFRYKEKKIVTPRYF